MKAKLSLIATAALGATSLLGANAVAGAGEDGAQTAGAARVTMGDNFFSPAKLTVAPGRTIRWVNNGNNPHTATARNGALNTGQLAPGQSRSKRLTRVGKYPYFCKIHPNMTGVIKVK